jgi:cytochrome c biogenesis protein CcmG, thiol:disulfide interchange protein DsbE
MTATRAAGGTPRLGGRLVTAIVVVVVGIAIAAIALLMDSGTTGKAAVAEGQLPVVGSTLRDFSVLAPDGHTVKLADFAGKPLWISFGGSWCPDCRSEAADLEAAYVKYNPQGLALLQVFSRDTATSAADFARMFGYTFALGLDPNEDLAYGYGVIGYPTHFFVGRDGKLRAVRSGRLSVQEMDNLVQQILK